MKIATYLTVLAAAGTFAIGCDKKKDDPATPVKAPEKSEPAPEKEAMPPKEVIPAPTPPVDPDPEPTIDPADEPVVDPVPTPPADPEPTPPAVGGGDHQAVFQNVLAAMESLITAIGEAEDVDDAVVRLTALEPDFKKVSDEMAATGEPDEATAADFNKQIEPVTERMKVAMAKLIGVDPSVFDSTSEPEPAVQEKLVEALGKIAPAMRSLMESFKSAWPNVGNE